jgi:hypothetical protein
MNIADIGAVGSMLVAVIALEVDRRRALRQSRNQLDEKLNTVGNRITALEVKIEVFWTGLMKDAAMILHHPLPEYARRDDLLEKLLAGELTKTEETELRSMLTHTIGTPKTVGDQGEQLAASILLRLLDTRD